MVRISPHVAPPESSATRNQLLAILARTFHFHDNSVKYSRQTRAVFRRVIKSE